MSGRKYLMTLALLCAALLLTAVGRSLAVNFDDAFAVWLFEEGSGDTLTDKSPQGNNGTITGGNWVQGQFGGGLHLENDTSIISATANGIGNQVISEVLWIKFDDFDVENQFGFIHATGTPNARFFYFSTWINGGPPHNGVHLGVIDAGGNWGRGLAIPKQFDENQWYHIAGVADAAGGSLKVYIDGKLAIENPIAAGEIPGDPDQFAVGAVPSEGGRFIHGTIDEVAFFNVALSEADIQDIMNNGLSASAAVEPDGKLSITWADLKQ